MKILKPGKVEQRKLEAKDHCRLVADPELKPMRMFSTIKETSRTLGVPEHILREMVAQGRCPGIRSGNRWLVNVQQLRELLDEMSARDVEKERLNESF